MSDLVVLRPIFEIGRVLRGLFPNTTKILGHRHRKCSAGQLGHVQSKTDKEVASWEMTKVVGMINAGRASWKILDLDARAQHPPNCARSARGKSEGLERSCGRIFRYQPAQKWKEGGRGSLLNCSCLQARI